VRSHFLFILNEYFAIIFDHLTFSISQRQQA